MFAASPLASSSTTTAGGAAEDPDAAAQSWEVTERGTYLKGLPREVLRAQADELDVPADATVPQMVTAILRAQEIERDRVVAMRLAATLEEPDQEFARPAQRPTFLSVGSQSSDSDARPRLGRRDSEASFMSAREFPLPADSSGASDGSSSATSHAEDGGSESSGASHLSDSIRAVVGAVGHTLVRGVMATLSGSAAEEGDNMDDSPLAAIVAAEEGPVGATEGEIAALTLQSTCEAGVRGNCAVCMDSLKVGEEVRTLPCLHRYHTSCIDEWLKSSPTCPVCKTSILMGIYEGTIPNSSSGDSNRGHRSLWSRR